MRFGRSAMNNLFTHRYAWAARALAVGLLVAGGGDAGPHAQAQTLAMPGANSPAANPTARWVPIGTLRGLCCNYTPFVVDAGHLTVFSNARGADDDGQLYRLDGTWNGLGPARRVLSAEQIHDVAPSAYKLRTLAVRRDPAIGWVAVLRVGPGYPTGDGYVPALATSADGIAWRYHGKLRIDGRLWPAFSDAATLVLQMDKPAVLDAARPFENRFLIFENNLSGEAAGRKLVAAFSADGLDWRFHRDAAGRIVDVWPADGALARDRPVFPTAESVNGDIHLMAGDGWAESPVAVKAHRHLCAPKGSSAFRYVGDASTWRAGAKVPNIAYERATDTLFAISQAEGFALRAASSACPPG